MLFRTRGKWLINRIYLSRKPLFFYRCTKDSNVDPTEVSFKGGFLNKGFFWALDRVGTNAAPDNRPLLGLHSRCVPCSVPQRRFGVPSRQRPHTAAGPHPT